MVDVVITYVDGTDPLWQRDYAAFAGKPVLEKRFRDWGTLPYLVAGIRRFMPFVRNIFLVVSRESQVPSWVESEPSRGDTPFSALLRNPIRANAPKGVSPCDGSDPCDGTESGAGEVKVVLHRDIIPEEYLPTFNSTEIEMFLHRIPGLAERFIYFNDDIFPVRECRESDFFTGDGKIVKGFSCNLLRDGLYKIQCANADRIARKVAGCRKSLFFRRPQHTVSPMLKSASEECYKAAEKEILASLSPLRERKNLNQNLFLNYLYHTGRAVNRRLSSRHYSLAVASSETIAGFIENPTETFVCVNDVRMEEDAYEKIRERLISALETRIIQSTGE